jgi:pimeloyl-ACP methyl ester carboxylesterase
MSRIRIGSGKAGDLTLVPYTLKSDGGKYRVQAELGRLLVPENRKKTDSNLIELAFVRLKSTAARPGPPFIFLAGGPGSSGIAALRGEGTYSWFQSLREIGDVIGLDQRGIGLSLPCLDHTVAFDLPLDKPGTREELIRVALQRSREVNDFWRNQGVDLSGYNTEENADDVDAVRAALGAEKMNLYGGSYGSHLAQATIRRHGRNVNRAIVSLVEGPDHTIKLPSNIQAQMERIAALVKASAKLSPLIPDFLELVRTVLGRLEREPVTVDVKHPKTGAMVKVCVGKFDLQRATASGLGSGDHIRKLPARYLAMQKGDYSWLVTEVANFRTGWLFNAMTGVMDSASGASPQRLARIRAEAKQTLLEDTIDLPFPHIGEAFGNPDLGDAFRSPIKSDVPVLFITGTLDGRTPVSNAEEVATGYPNSQHLIVENMAHSLAEHANDPEMRATMHNFLKGQAATKLRGRVPLEFEMPA